MGKCFLLRATGVGALAPEMVRSCMSRLKAWAILAREVIHAWFPSFDAIYSVRIFDVSAGNELETMRWRP
eukprot:6762547-Prorocentrum_lima.AAC.1